jgi:hypothetical protein
MRYELAYYCDCKVLGVLPSDFDRWKNIVCYTETANGDDIRDGNLDFELALVGLMRVMGSLVELRVGLGVDDDTPERREKGAQIRAMLKHWKNTLPQQFKPIEMPKEVKFLESCIPTGMNPIFYRSLNMAVAMGKL